MESTKTPEIHADLVRQVILNFLQIRLNEKLKKEENNLAKAKSLSNQSDIELSEQKIFGLKTAFELDNWIHDAATRRIHWMSISTHISKGIHSDSKGNNINYIKAGKPLNDCLISSDTLKNLTLDATGNAAALDIFAFLKLPIANTTLMQLIIDEHPALIDSLSSDPSRAELYIKQFKNIILVQTLEPVTHERNKQILWPTHQNFDGYTCLIPLHPSSLCYQFYQKINTIKFSDQIKEAKENRKKKMVTQMPYPTIQNLAIVKLGGSNPQGVSQLTSAQGGRNYLLPNLPPKLQSSKAFKISAVAVTIFNKRLRYHSYRGWLEFDEVIQAKKSVMAVRDQRKLALQMILAEVFQIAERIQTQWPAGWSRDYQLSMAEKYWLDPDRADLEGEEAFKAACDAGDWAGEVIRSFALWLNQWLKETHTAIAEDFDEAEESEWRRAMASALRTSQRRFGRIYA